jgi:hypothetical protein
VPFRFALPAVVRWWPSRGRCLWWAALGCWLGCAPGFVSDARAQPLHRCTTPGGQDYWLDRPCPSASAPTSRLQQHGSEPAAAVPRAAGSPAGRMLEVQAHHQFLMSAACKELSEALRTAEHRGVGADVVQGLNKEWRQRCQDEDNAARLAHEEHLLAERKKAEETRRQAKAAVAQQQARQELCDELQRLLAKRRQRGRPPSAGEQADLQRFEASHEERCGSR